MKNMVNLIGFMELTKISLVVRVIMQVVPELNNDLLTVGE